jgi:oligopeptidase B
VRGPIAAVASDETAVVVRDRSAARLALACALLAVVARVAADDAGTPVNPPRAAVVAHEVRARFGAVRNDPYFWLRDDTRSNPQVLDYLKAENAYADRMLEPLDALRAAVQKELKDRVPPQDSSVPFREGDYWYYRRFESGQEYPVVARKKMTLDAPEEILLDEPKLAPANGFFSVGRWAVSPNGELLAWTEDRVGRLQYELHVKNLKTGQVLADSIAGLSSDILWGGDNKTILYIVNDTALRPEWLKAHVIGEPASADRLVYQETDDAFYSVLFRTNDKSFLCLNDFSQVASEWRCASSKTPTDFRILSPRENGHLYDVDHAQGTWFFRTNWKAPNFRVMSAADAEVARGRDAWREVVPTSADALIEGVKAFEGYIALEETAEANRRVLIRTADGHTRTIPAEEPAYAMSLTDDQDAANRWLRYEYQSLTTPTITREMNVDSGAERTLKTTSIPGYDRTQYVTERAWVTARDGARVPVSLLHKKDWKRDGKGALLQYGYGAYGVAIDTRFSAEAVSLADRGVVYAIAHVRGGEEKGRSWYDDGRVFHKMNTFTDFIDVTRGLVTQGYAAKDRVAALGRSGGGLLMGGIANMAPADYRVILAIVPFVDAVTTMLDASIPLTTREYTEWGNPNRKPDYEYMLRYSPYDNVGRHPYPAMYVYTGLWDSQVQYYEPTKWVAKLRATKTDGNPLVLRVNMEGGHGGPGGRFQQAQARAEYLAFALWELSYRE